MAMLEGEWRKRERAREQEAAELRAEYLNMEERTRGVSTSLSKRGRWLEGHHELLLQDWAWRSRTAQWLRLRPGWQHPL
jgi:centrosomal protein CEP120